MNCQYLHPLLESYKHLLYFINEAIKKSNELYHHPIISIEKDKATVKLYTHDINDVTEQDLKLSKYFDEIFQDIVETNHSN